MGLIAHAGPVAGACISYDGAMVLTTGGSDYGIMAWQVCVCCSVLQCVAVCCSVLQCFIFRMMALWCSQLVAPTMVLWLGRCVCVAACCSVLRCVAMWCIWYDGAMVLTTGSSDYGIMAWQVCCTVLCSVLQRVAVCFILYDGAIVLTSGGSD